MVALTCNRHDHRNRCVIELRGSAYKQFAVGIGQVQRLIRTSALRLRQQVLCGLDWVFATFYSPFQVDIPPIQSQCAVCYIVLHVSKELFTCQVL